VSGDPLPLSRFAAFASDWIAAFNAHDLARILDHYRADIELVSPLYLRFTGGLSDRVQGIEALEAYIFQA
jgi:ketosteroid isomerase-like protein